jgi:hypothetical protein
VSKTELTVAPRAAFATEWHAISLFEWRAYVTAGFRKDRTACKQIVYSLAMDSLEAVMRQAAATMSPIASRLETCTRIGPYWV